MKNVLFWLGLAVFLTTGAWIVWEKEQLLAHGRTVLLRLAPVDPRSLMQGDYMALRYELARQIPSDKQTPPRGRVIVKLDADGVGQFARLDDGTALSPGEVALKYARKGEFRIASGAYFFQEGTGQVYQAAKFAELKVDDRGTCLLTALRDENRAPLGAAHP